MIRKWCCSGKFADFVSRARSRSVALPVLAALLALPACAGLDESGFSEQGELLDSSATLTLVQEYGPGAMLSLRGARLGDPGGQTYAIGYAAAVAARGNDIFVVDQAAGQLVQINAALGDARMLISLSDPNTHGVYVAPDLTVYVVDKFNRAVRRLNDAGQTTRLYADPNLIPAPVDVAETGWGDSIVVADALNKHLVMFDPLAGAFHVMGPNSSRAVFAQTVHALAATRNSVYLLDPEMGEVMRFGLRGNPLGSYGEDELQLPTALAVDGCGRLFVADQSRRGILVSLSDMMVLPTRVLNRELTGALITDLWVDDNFLYVAAGAGGVMIFRIEPACSAL